MRPAEIVTRPDDGSAQAARPRPQQNQMSFLKVDLDDVAEFNPVNFGTALSLGDATADEDDRFPEFGQQAATWPSSPVRLDDVAEDYDDEDQFVVDRFPEFGQQSATWPSAPARLDDIDEGHQLVVDLDFLDDEDAFAGLGEEFFTLAPLDVLRTCFPDIDGDRLVKALADHGYHLPSTLDALYERTPASTERKRAAVCRFALAGHCARSDCQFDHDLSSFVCRFYLSPQGCLKGDNCEFLHDGFPDAAASMKPKETLPRATADISSREEFPDLGGPKAKVGSSIPIPFSFGPQYAKTVKQPPKPNALQPNERSTKIINSDGSKKRPAKVEDIAWRATGDDVSRLYIETRRLAFEQAAARNKYFQLAAELYRKGAKAEAARMASRGRELNDQVQSLHSEAAARILRERDTGNLLELDAHGLHPQEAVFALQDRLSKLSEGRIAGVLKVIVGTGNHSRARGLQLAGAIETYLKGHRYKYSHGTLADRKGGLILVPLS